MSKTPFAGICETTLPVCASTTSILRSAQEMCFSEAPPLHAEYQIQRLTSNWRRKRTAVRPQSTGRSWCPVCGGPRRRQSAATPGKMLVSACQVPSRRVGSQDSRLSRRLACFDPTVEFSRRVKIATDCWKVASVFHAGGPDTILSCFCERAASRARAPFMVSSSRVRRGGQGGQFPPTTQSPRSTQRENAGLTRVLEARGGHTGGVPLL